jgi:hypothetical protein
VSSARSSSSKRQRGNISAIDCFENHGAVGPMLVFAPLFSWRTI